MTQASGVSKWGASMAHAQRSPSATCALGLPSTQVSSSSATCSLGLPAQRQATQAPCMC